MSLGPAFSSENSTMTLFLFSKQSKDSAQRACKLKAATELSLTMKKRKRKEKNLQKVKDYFGQVCIL